MIADLHCDLLLYLQQGKSRSPYDEMARCSIPSMRKSPVVLQVLPIFTETFAGSTHKGNEQNEIFHDLSFKYPEAYRLLKVDADKTQHEQTAIIRSIENASAFCEENEDLATGMERLQKWHAQGPLAYISLTWNTENRFGGGNLTAVGLKQEGQQLLDWMHNKRIAVDLSHTSDQLAYDIINYVDKQKLHIPLIASHSNCRSIMDVPRNLPDELIQAILQRKGIIGLNFIKPFLGFESPHVFSKHLEHLLKLGAENHVCFGADFFFEEDLAADMRRPPGEYFHTGYECSAHYPKVLLMWKQELGLSDTILHKIAYQTANAFLKEHVL